MQKVILGIIGLVIVIGLIAYFMKADDTDVMIDTTPATTTQKTTVATASTLTLAENTAGNKITATRATLVKPGYVVVYRTNTDGKVTAAGHSTILGAGEHTNVVVTLDSPVKEKDTVVAVLYEDNGDGTFDAEGEILAMQNGAPVSAIDVIGAPKATTDTALMADIEKFLKAQLDEMTKKDAAATQTTTTTTTTTTTDILAVTVHGSNYKFDPATIKAKVGQTVRVTFINDSGTHDFVIDAFKAKGAMTKQLQSGKSETIEFVADKKGSFEYYCSVGNHRAMGMKGTLVVE